MKIFYLGMVKNGFEQSSFWTPKLTIARVKWWEELIFVCWYKFIQIKRWLNMLEVDMVKNGCSQSCNGIIKFTVSVEWADGINWLLACWYRFTKIKSWSKLIGWACSKMGVNGCDQTLSHKWTDRVNWLFACHYRFRKAKSWFNDFWVGVVKNGSGLFIYETLKSAVY